MVTDQSLVIFICFSAISKGKLSLHDHHPLCKSHTYRLYVLSFLKPVLLHYILYVSIIGPFSRSLSPLIFRMLCTCFPISLHYRYTLLMLYCISVRLFDSSIPCRLTISLFLYIPICIWRSSDSWSQSMIFFL